MAEVLLEDETRSLTLENQFVMQMAWVVRKAQEELHSEGTPHLPRRSPNNSLHTHHLTP